MKIKHLSLAILTALSLTACVGNSNNDAVDNSNKDKTPDTPKAVCGLEHPEACKTAEEKEKLKKLQEEAAAKNKPQQDQVGKPAHTGDTNGNATSETGTGLKGLNENETPANTVIADAGKRPTVGAAQYVRNAGSTIDQLNNPSSRKTPNSGTYVYSEKLNEKLENFVAAQTLGDQPFADDPKHEHGTYGVTYYLGYYDKDDYSPTLMTSVTSETPNWNHSTSKFRTLEEINKNNAVIDSNLNITSGHEKSLVLYRDASQVLLGAVDNSTVEDSNATLDSSLSSATFNSKVFYASDKVAKGTYLNYTKPNFVTTNLAGNKNSGEGYVKGTEESDAVRSGLIYEGVVKENGGLIGGDDANDSIAATRIFGRKYKDQNEQDTDVNSYERAEVTVAPYSSTVKEYGIVVKPMHLDYVQYGRVTGNFNLHKGDDKLKWQDIGDHLENGILYAHTDTIGRRDVNGLSWYFSRGLNATPLTKDGDAPHSMDLKLPEGQSVLNYAGHALTYGFNNSVLSAGSHPNSMGGAVNIGVGDFVSAEFNVKNSSVNGSIYRFVLTDPKDRDSGKPYDLVTFTGSVLGNTVTGTSMNKVTGDASLKQGTFHANFFGPSANELGGTVNAVKDNAFGPGKAWGAVFGAKATVTPVQTKVFTNLENHN